MMTRVNKVFEYILEKDGEVKFRGCKFEVCEFLKCLSIEIDEAIKYGFKLCGYDIRRELTERESFKRNKNKDLDLKVAKKVDKRLNYLIKHLNEYGNTCLGCLPIITVERYIKELKKYGLKVKYRVVKYKGDNRQWYILEVVNE